MESNKGSAFSALAVAENFLELASSQRLQILFKLMERSRKRIEPMAKELDATKQEVHRNLVRLEQSGLITKDREGKYSLTTFGRTMCAEIPSILFLSQHRDYFLDHDFGDIPVKFVMRAGQLATGSHIKGLNSRGMHPISSVDREIDEEDIRQVVRAAQPQLPPGQDMLHTLRQYFRVDGQDDVKNPVGRMASRVELDVHVVCGQRTRIQNPIRLVKGLGIEVADVAFNGRVMALPLLTSQIGEQGALVIDFGAGTTEYAVYLDGSLSHSGVYAIGGDHVTNDLAVGLKLTQSKAERLKLDHGRAVFDPRQANRTVNFSSDVGFDDKQISVGHIYQIMSARLIELFELIRADLERNELIRRINGGILLCGGGARIPQIDILAREVLGLDVLNNNEPDGLVSQSFAIQPEFVTAMGLVRYGARKIKTENSKKPGLIGWLVGN